MALITTLDLYQAVLRELDNTASPEFDVPDFNYWFNKAIIQFFWNETQEFEITQKATDALRFFMEDDSVVFNADDTTNLKEQTLPAEYIRLLNCRVVFRYKAKTDCNKIGDTVTKVAQRLTSDNEPWVEENSYFYPSFTKSRVFYRVKGTDKLEILFDTDKFPENDIVIKEVKIEYLIDPEEIILATDFTPGTGTGYSREVNQKIVNLCAQFFIESLNKRNRLESHGLVNG